MVILAKLVMPGLMPGIHVFAAASKEDVDGRVKPGHAEKAEHGFLLRSMLEFAERFPPPAALSERVDLPRKRER
jgi:hypothetical protein